MPLTLDWLGPLLSTPLPTSVEYRPGQTPKFTLIDSTLAIDPGETCGWAQIIVGDHSTQYNTSSLLIGECTIRQLTSRESALLLPHKQIIVEEPPRGIVRAFEPEVYMAYGVIRDRRPDLIIQRPPDMRIAHVWHKLKGRVPGGVSVHARDGLAHLCFWAGTALKVGNQEQLGKGQAPHPPG